MEFVNVINERYIRLVKSPTLYPKFKVELLDESEQNVIKEIIQDIDAGSPGSININSQQGVRRSCSFNIINTNGEYSPSSETGMFWIRSKFKLYIGLKDPENDDIYWFPQGVYYVSNPVNAHHFSNKYITINGVDKFGIFGSDLGYGKLDGTYKIEAGQNAYNAIKSILMFDIGNGSVIDPVEPILDPSLKDVVLPVDIIKLQSDNLSDILIDLANSLGANIYYDVNGRLNIHSGTIDYLYSQEAPIWDFSDIELEYMENDLSYRYDKVLNSVTIIGSNINDKIYEYTAVNNNPLSPTRIEYIGIKSWIDDENPYVTDEESAKSYAEFELNRLSILQMLSNFNSSLIPHLDADRVCTITDKHYKYQQERFVIQSIVMPFGIGDLMQNSVSNIASLPYYSLLST